MTRRFATNKEIYLENKLILHQIKGRGDIFILSTVDYHPFKEMIV